MQGPWLVKTFLLSTLALMIAEPGMAASGLSWDPPSGKFDVLEISAAVGDKNRSLLTTQRTLSERSPTTGALLAQTLAERLDSPMARPPNIARFYLAIRQRNLTIAAEQLALGIDPNMEPDSSSSLVHPEFGPLSPLFEAVLVDDVAILARLIHDGPKKCWRMWHKSLI